MNFHPSVLTNAAFLERPRSREKLMRVVGLIEKTAVAKERKKGEELPPVSSGNKFPARTVSRGAPARSRQASSGSFKCWGCGQPGHFKRDCSRNSAPPANERSPGDRQAPGAKCGVHSEKLQRYPMIHPCGLDWS
jgi:hypothetical protein